MNQTFFGITGQQTADSQGLERKTGNPSAKLRRTSPAPTGRVCSWGIPLAEAYGVRLPMDYDGGIPPQMRMMDVPEGEYIVFEHGPFDFETENAAVEAQIEQAMKDFDYEKSGYRLDLTQERVFYFFHDCKRYWKYVRPVVRKESDTSKQV